MWHPTPRTTTLGLRLNLERLRRARKGQEVKGRRLRMEGGLVQAKKGRKEKNSRVFIEKRKTISAKKQAMRKGAGLWNADHVKHSLVGSQA